MKQAYNTIRVTARVDEILSTHRFILGGQLASVHNDMLIKQALRAWVFIPLELVRLSYLKSNQIESFIDSTIKEIIKHDFLFTLESLDSVYRRLIQGNFKRSDFKDHFTIEVYRICRTVYPFLFDWGTVTSPSEDLMRNVVSYLRFLSKLSFDMPSLKSKALNDFLETESRLRTLSFEDNVFIPQLQKILSMWLKDLDVSFLPVRHGSGSVAEGSLSKGDKYLQLGIDPMLKMHLTFQFPDTWKNYYPIGFSQENSFVRNSRVTFVPKSATKLRTICMEPTTLQYFQQGIMRVTYRFIDNHSFLGSKIVLKDQSQNQEGARLGSSLDNYATIDLSAASDSVSWLLVRKLFHNTKYLGWAAATRSTGHVLPDDSVVPSHKFAPMGSALCFPTECLIFCAVVELVARKHDYTLENDNSYSFYSVYGDDIVCPTCWANEVIEILLSLGFIVNKEKSYLTGPFRESCGKEYYRGIDITPIYYRLDVLDTSLTAKDYFKLCTGANNAFEHGLTFLRSYFIDILMNAPKRKLSRWRLSQPVFSTSSEKPPYIFSPCPTNFHLPISWNRDLQKTMVKYLNVSSRDVEQECSFLADTIGYHEFLIESLFNPNRDLEEPVIRSIVPKRLSWKTASIATELL